MKRLFLAFLLLLSSRVLAEDTTFYSVAYIEVKPSSRTQAVAALKGYREAVHRDDANIRLELFEQADRAGHFVIVETWRTSAAFDAKTAARKQLMDLMEPMRTSGWDARPYKTLSVASGPAAPTARSIYVISHVDVAPDPKVAAMLTTL